MGAMPDLLSDEPCMKKWQTDRPSWLAGGGRNACITKQNGRSRISRKPPPAGKREEDEEETMAPTFP